MINWTRWLYGTASGAFKLVILLLCIPLFAAGQAKPGNDRVITLTPGATTERKLEGGEAHLYRIMLASNQYLHIIVDQRGIDVALTLFSPEGKLEVKADSQENSSDGQESIRTITNIQGYYQLEVRSLHNGALPGSYRLHIPDVRTATLKDRELQEARDLFSQASERRDRGRYDEALALAKRALIIRDKFIGDANPEVAQTLNLIGWLYAALGRYEEAEPVYKRALVIYERNLGPDRPEIGESLTTLGLLYQARGDYDTARVYFQRAQDIYERLFGPTHPEVAGCLANIANLDYLRGDFARAEISYKRVLSIYEKVVGSEHPLVADTFVSLGDLYIAQGAYTDANQAYVRALDIRERFFGIDDRRVAEVTRSLAAVNIARGNYLVAKAQYHRALAIYEKIESEYQLDYAAVLSNLAWLYSSQQDYARAEPLYLRAIALYHEKLKPSSIELTMAYNSIGKLYQSKGEYTKAESYYRRSISGFESIPGPSNLMLAEPINNLAVLNTATGQYTEAEQLFQQALSLYERGSGADQQDFARILNNLATLYEAKGDIDRAITTRSRGNDISERNISLKFNSYSERGKSIYLKTLSDETNRTISLNILSSPRNLAASRLALTTILRRKGRALDAMAGDLAALRASSRTEDQRLLDELAAAKTKLSELSRSTGDAFLKESARVGELIERLEGEVSARSAARGVNPEPVTIKTIQSLIPRGAALVEIVGYTPYAAKTSANTGPRYAAYILGPESEPLGIDLGEAAPIDQAIMELRDGIEGRRPDFRQRARALEAKVTAPIRRLLGAARTVLISPDGALNLVPFAALVDENNHYLIETYTFVHLTSGRDLMRTAVGEQSKQGSLILAAPDFGGVNRNGTKQPPNRPSDTQPFFYPLPGTDKEARSIAEILTNATVLSGSRATKEAVKSAVAPRILHLAVPAFFLTSAGNSSQDNPLLRAGLVFAGANRPFDGTGLMTALEVSSLNLSGTKLVVLPACDTGIGDVKVGDGVYGLKRAFVLAGSESQVSSLWKVEDMASADLMIDFYKRLHAGESRADALRQSQLKMLSTKEHSHPFYWAAFIQSGDWRIIR